jgi:hypothetical protein
MVSSREEKVLYLFLLEERRWFVENQPKDNINQYKTMVYVGLGGHLGALGLQAGFRRHAQSKTQIPTGASCRIHPQELWRRPDEVTTPRKPHQRPVIGPLVGFWSVLRITDSGCVGSKAQISTRPRTFVSSLSRASENEESSSRLRFTARIACITVV